MNGHIEYTVYRLFDADRRLLYVGMTKNLPRRLAAHRQLKPWWSEVAHTTHEPAWGRAAAREAERAAILAEGPLYNIDGNPAPPPFAGKRGRPPLATDGETVHLSICAPVDLIAAVDQLAAERGITRSEAVRLALTEYAGRDTTEAVAS